MSKPPPPADANLVNFLRQFYSIGQLQIILSMYTDGAAIPGVSDKERDMRIAAIRQILSEPPPKVQLQDMPQQIETLKMELTKAERLARGLFDMMEEYCDRIHIAGSIRRQKPLVKDIELICQAKTFVAGGGGLFDEGTRHYAIIPAFRRTVEGLGTILKGKPDGRYMQIALPSGINLDLFLPADYDYFRQYAIRTGSADYSAQVIATGWKRKGWCGTSGGLRRIADCEETSSGWKCINPHAELPPVWQSEEEFFDFIGVEWIEPKLRTV